MVEIPQRRYTLEEYFDLELSSDARYEYCDGDVFCMSGVSEAHAQVEINLTTSLSSLLGNSQCCIFLANMRIKVPTLPPYRYADLSVTSEKPIFETIGGVDTLVNPSLIIEVLSDSTEAYDRGDKFSHYKSIPSLREYLLIAQHRAHVTQFVKLSDTTWGNSEVNDLSATLPLLALDRELRLEDVYQGVTFPEKPLPNLHPPSE
ncbi:MAG TPA: Uma2 family endonuclease [Blastocatellia bacterium]|nr:Uma2 family endonuclease [Blastocatellia bacterium]